MTSKLSFKETTHYLGIAIEPSNGLKIKEYVDLEGFFLECTKNFKTSRMAEGILCWLKRYSHLLSPSKIRRHIGLGITYDQAVLGAFLFLIENKQFEILKPFVKKAKQPISLLNGPKPRNPHPDFLRYNILVPNFKLIEEKFLLPTKAVYKKCVELRNRALFGSAVNADVASYLNYHPEATPYEISKMTGNHKARVFKVFGDVKEAG